MSLNYNNAAAYLVDGVPNAVWYPVDYGFLSWTINPEHVTGTYTLATAGTVYVAAVKANARLVTNIVVNVTTAGSSLTANQCFAGLYQNGVLAGSTADQSGVWNSTGLKTMPLVAPFVANQGVYYVALVFNGTTGPTVSAGTATVANVNLAAASSRYGTANTGVTTALPASLGAISALAQTPFAALS